MDNLTRAQRQQRQNIRNGYLVESVETIKAGMDQQDEFGKSCLQDLLDECEKHGVDNFGKTPAF
jgi:hypothetical protein